MTNKFYVYLHRRITDNKVFYVGKGSADRANSPRGRSAWWSRTANNHGFVVEIIFDSLDEETAFQVEKDTILEHRYFGSPLVNISESGEGSSGYKHTDETKARMAASQKRKSSFRQNPFKNVYLGQG